MAKLTILASMLAKLEGSNKEAFLGEISDLLSSKTGGLEFQKINIENDIIKSMEGESPTGFDENIAQQKFEEASKKYGATGPQKYAGVNVQEI